MGFSSSFVPKFLLEVTELGVKILCLSCILWFKNGIIFAYRWRGESRAVAACKGVRVEIEKRIDAPNTEIWKILHRRRR